MNAIVSPVDIKSSQFKAMTSNSIRSVVKSVLDGNSHVALDRNSPCFAIESISNQKPCPGSNEIKFEKSQIRASSFLETYTENYDDGNVLKNFVFYAHSSVHSELFELDAPSLNYSKNSVPLSRTTPRTVKSRPAEARLDDRVELPEKLFKLINLNKLVYRGL